MNKKNIFNLSHIIGFFIGVLVTIIINWLLFKDPKKITAPGVASLVAICTFSLALYSAYQVKKWLNSKINETAFKKSDEFLSILCEVNNKLAELNMYVRTLHLRRNAKDYEKWIDHILTLNIELNKLIVSAYNCSYTFATWGIDFIQATLFDKAMFRCGRIIGNITSLGNMEIRNHEHCEFYIKELTELLGYMDSSYYYVHLIVSKPYHSKFVKIQYHV